jgi:hypothetical protein
MQSLDDVKYEQWSRTRLDRLLVDYLLRYGYKESATALAREKDINDLVDVETFVQMSRIRESLRNGRVTEALSWCTENKKELRRMEVRLMPLIFQTPLTYSSEQSRIHAAIPTVYRARTDTGPIQTTRVNNPCQKVPYTVQR